MHWQLLHAVDLSDIMESLRLRVGPRAGSESDSDAGLPVAPDRDSEPAAPESSEASELHWKGQAASGGEYVLDTRRDWSSMLRCVSYYRVSLSSDSPSPSRA